jgi:hypothetical protein
MLKTFEMCETDFAKLKKFIRGNERQSERLLCPESGLAITDNGVQRSVCKAAILSRSCPLRVKNRHLPIVVRVTGPATSMRHSPAFDDDREPETPK